MSPKKIKRFPASNILLIQLGDIGDVVLTTPTIRAVKANYPDARVSIMVRKPFGSLLAADSHLFEVVESTKPNGSLANKLKEYLGFVFRLRKARYDLVIDLRTGDRGAFLSFLTGAKERVGFRGSRSFWHSMMFTTVIQDIHADPLATHQGADQSLRVIRSIGIDIENSIPHLTIGGKDRERVIELLEELGPVLNSAFATINPCSRWKYKEWGYEKWGYVADYLWREYKLSTVLVGAPEDRKVLDEIVDSRENHVFNLAGKTTLGELAALLSMSDLHLGVDSAAPHIAFAVGAPTVTVFGPGNWSGWTVTDNLHRVVTSAMICVPCNRKGCDDLGHSRCIDELSVDSVIQSAVEVLRYKRLQS
jgi:heptosyltransferase-3